MYQGYYKDYKKHGQGKFIFANGDVYDGMGCEMNVYDIIYMQQYLVNLFINLFKGEWANDLPSGQGTMLYTNKEQYVGQWEHGRWNGKTCASLVRHIIYTVHTPIPPYTYHYVATGTIYFAGMGTFTNSYNEPKDGLWEDNEYACVQPEQNDAK